ncbi:anoctamin-1 isoform X1 [Cotesia glomerata]|uniref:anoctamin-1 isoform X1 n=1 Tax=Cotesia glomerata TaxID=32391 RepID=UPI001D001C44|nr:anoctamin-1 isoform X1 [Cotesia glomerata]XP_044597840.1 anoctamin-1 isoform X1 [Cotesia glomerata]XP_044597841.1 anoctamin-1 isoform X1 [Cotesia glomerata]
MEEETDNTEVVNNRASQSTSPSIYRSTQSNLNKGSQHTVYYSVRNTMYEDALNEGENNQNENENSNRMTTDDDSCTARGTEETVIDGSCQDLEHEETSNLYFRDGIRSIDFVIVWDEHDEEALTARCTEFRKTFEENLELEGLQLEYESPELSGLRFIKIHAPLEVLRRYAEILKLRLPMKEVMTGPLLSTRPSNTIIREVNGWINNFMKHYYVDRRIFPKIKHRFTAVFSRDKEYLFDYDAPNFFSPATHSRIVQFILDRTKFTRNKADDFAFGVDRLISEHAYVAAYPLHDGNLHTPDSMRYLLYTHWASMRKCFHYQPLDYIKEYFGVKIGLYFAWLGFYTHMLVPASIIGLICFIYGCLTLSTNETSEDICNGNKSIYMCPLCDKICGYWDLRETCLHGRLTYLFDNPSTVFFAIFMSLWATLFLELWKKYSAEITHRWDLTGLDAQEEHPRPQYLAKLAHIKKKSINSITHTAEPKVPFWSMRLPATILSFSVILLLIAVAMAAVIGVILYRMSVLTTLSFYGQSSITSNAILFTTATAACLNLCCIFLFNWIYVWLAEYLTELELLRTQTEFDDSLTLKIYLLQFVNYYASIFYIAFFKGKFVGHPRTYKRFFRYRQEECGPGGCLTELCIQLSIIMIGKQFMNSLLEMLFPLYYKWMNTWKVQIKAGNHIKQKEKFIVRKQWPWLKDFKLVEWGPRSLFPEYLEMGKFIKLIIFYFNYSKIDFLLVLQYGFITIFVAAFPLAPFFALINNIFEMRLDAKKLLTMYRRPVGQRVRDIGIWFRILDSISKLSVITNAFIIAFTSNFIPKLVYQLSISDNRSLDGFLEYSLSKFNTSDFLEEHRPLINTYQENIEICRYPDFREPPTSPNKYDLTNTYWHILAARLAFVVAFENAVALVMIFVRWCIPDISPKLADKIRREAYVTNEIIIQHEAQRACSRSFAVDEPEVIRRRAYTYESTDRWNRVMRDSFTMADFDLEVHGAPSSPVRTGPAAL